MNRGTIINQKDKDGLTLKIGNKVVDNDGYEYEIAFIDGLDRVMIDEPICCKIFELDSFPVRLVNER